MAEALMQAPGISISTLRHLLNDLGEELVRRGVTAEIAVYGGAAMLLLFNNRPMTQDVDFTLIEGNAEALAAAAAQVGERHGAEDGWLNDAVGMFISGSPELTPYGDYPVCSGTTGLRVFVTKPEYILAMKMLAMRSSLEAYDIQDIWVLLDACGVDSIDKAEQILETCLPGECLSDRNRAVLMDIINDKQEGAAYDPMRYW